jgi:hypothetical protein
VAARESGVPFPSPAPSSSSSLVILVICSAYLAAAGVYWPTMATPSVMYG